MQLLSGRRTEQGIRQRAMMARERERIEREKELQARLARYREDIGKFHTSTSVCFRLRDRWVANAARVTTFHRIEGRAAKTFGVSVVALKSVRRRKELALARQFVMYWAMRLTPLSTTQIGQLMGGRDHTTIMHGRDAYLAKRAKMGRTLRPAK